MGALLRNCKPAAALTPKMRAGPAKEIRP